MHTVWKALIALGASTAGTIAFLIIGCWFIAYFATHPPRRRLKRSPAMFGAKFEDIVFPSRDGVLLRGWFVPGRTATYHAYENTGVPPPKDDPSLADRPRGAVILCHGMSANRAEVLHWAKPLWEQGFTLLMFDFRALGQSDGDLCTAGYHETQDLHAAVDYLKSREETRELPIGVFGFSMGGATAILAAADDSRIASVATHGAFATLQRAIRQRCRHHFGLLAPIANWLMVRVGQWYHWYPVSPSQVSPINAVSRLTPRPLLLLHGMRDKIIHPADARDLHDAAGAPKSLCILPRSGHKRIHRKLRKEVRARVAEFFCETLPAAHSARRPPVVTKQ